MMMNVVVAATFFPLYLFILSYNYLCGDTVQMKDLGFFIHVAMAQINTKDHKKFS